VDAAKSAHVGAYYTKSALRQSIELWDGNAAQRIISHLLSFYSSQNGR
jgi:hypothetical protein